MQPHMLYLTPNPKQQQPLQEQEHKPYHQQQDLQQVLLQMSQMSQRQEEMFLQQQQLMEQVAEHNQLLKTLMSQTVT